MNKIPPHKVVGDVGKPGQTTPAKEDIQTLSDYIQSVIKEEQCTGVLPSLSESNDTTTKPL